MQPDCEVAGLGLTGRGERELGLHGITVAMAANSNNCRDISTIENTGAWGIQFPPAPNLGGRHADANSR